MCEVCVCVLEKLDMEMEIYRTELQTYLQMVREQCVKCVCVLEKLEMEMEIYRTELQTYLQMVREQCVTWLCNKHACSITSNTPITESDGHKVKSIHCSENL